MRDQPPGASGTIAAARNFEGGLRVHAPMDAILADMFPVNRIGYPVIFARFTGAILPGAAIGFEREAKNRPADMNFENFRFDPLRVVEAVTAGVAFLAAGTIVLSRGEIHGITTGAGLWLAGAVGLCLGFGHWIIGLAAVPAGLVILFIVGLLERRFGSGGCGGG